MDRRHILPGQRGQEPWSPSKKSGRGCFGYQPHLASPSRPAPGALWQETRRPLTSLCPDFAGEVCLPFLQGGYRPDVVVHPAFQPTRLRTYSADARLNCANHRDSRLGSGCCGNERSKLENIGNFRICCWHGGGFRSVVFDDGLGAPPVAAASAQYGYIPPSLKGRGRGWVALRIE